MVAEVNPLLPELDTLALLEWVKGQTLKAMEVIRWEPASGVARALVGSDHAWEARDLKTLCRGLAGRYVCMASEDLLLQENTYLEENLAALESESLIFTVNTLGASGWATRNLDLGTLPGSRLQPLIRTVVRKEYVGEGYSIDIPAWITKMQGSPSVVGKWITHSTSRPEVATSWPVQAVTGRGTRPLES